MSKNYDFPQTCNDCKHSSAIGWSLACNVKKRPKEVKHQGYLSDSGRTSVLVKPTMTGCRKWEQGKPSVAIYDIDICSLHDAD